MARFQAVRDAFPAQRIGSGFHCNFIPAMTQLPKFGTQLGDKKRGMAVLRLSSA
jgi:hypothetical protein